MSRKDYTAVAAIISAQVLDAENYPAIEQEAAWNVLRSTAEGLAAVFKADNANFDFGRFMTACGL